MPSIATCTADIGQVKGFEFEVQLRFERDFHSPPIKYTLPQRRWLNAYVKELLQLGIIGECSSTNCCNVVLVPQGQTDLDFRVCVNYRPLNSKLLTPRYPMPDIQCILDILG